MDLVYISGGSLVGTVPLFPQHITRHQAVEKEFLHRACISPTTYCEQYTAGISHWWEKSGKDTFKYQSSGGHDDNV